MTAFTLCKFTVLYCSTSMPQNILVNVLRTSMLLLAIYTLLNLVLVRRSFITRLVFHEILALIVLSDLIYFKYFNMLPEVTDLQFLKVLPTIWSSISSLFSSVYLLLFTDALLLIFHHYFEKKQEKAPEPRVLPSLIAASIMFIFIFADFSLSGIKSSGQAYESFGLLHYHVSQILNILPVNNNENSQNAKSTQIETEMKTVAKDPLYFGKAMGRNIIVIQVEALQDFVINMNYNGQEITPNLNKLLTLDTIYFNRFYQQLGKGCTSDAEFVTQNSLYPSMDLPAYRKYQNNRFMGLPMIMRENGYSTYAFHAYKPEFWNRQNIYPMLGYDRFINMNDFSLDETFGWGLSDKCFFEQSAEYLNIANKPFYSFLITLSSHHPYALPQKYKKLQLQPEHNDTLLGRYIQIINYTDEALGLFIEKLREYGLYEDSIIAIYGDHRGIASGVTENDKLMSELLGHEYTFAESLNVPLLIHVPGTDINLTNSRVGGQMDFLPTMLNLLGIKENRLKLFGQDLLNAEKGFVASQSSMIKGSFIDDYKIFVMSRDGVFENSNAWYLNSGEPVDLELCRDGYERALREIQESEYILANDLIQEFVTFENIDTTFNSALKVTLSLKDRITKLFNIITE